MARSVKSKLPERIYVWRDDEGNLFAEESLFATGDPGGDPRQVGHYILNDIKTVKLIAEVTP